MLRGRHARYPGTHEYQNFEILGTDGYRVISGVGYRWVPDTEEISEVWFQWVSAGDLENFKRWVPSSEETHLQMIQIFEN